jgi:serine/threonine-protein kinase
LDWALEARPAPPPSRSLSSWILAGALGILGLVALGGWWLATRPVDRPLVRLSVDLGPDALVSPTTTAAISPDGQRIVFPSRGGDGKQYLSTRQLDQALAAQLSGTEGGHDPFFSADGQWIGFFTGDNLKKVPAKGGDAITIRSIMIPFGGSWSEDGSIVASLAAASPLWRVSSASAHGRHVMALSDGDITHRWPQVLPGGNAVLFTASSTQSGMDGANIKAFVFKTGVTKTVQRVAYFGRYLPSGHLLYVHQGVLYAVAFDAGRLETRGAPIALVTDVAANSDIGAGQFDVSRNGTLVYLAGHENTGFQPVVWLDSSGNTRPLLSTPGLYYQLRLSPDGKRLALVASSKGNDIFVYDWQKDAMTRLTFDGHSAMPIWHPDGKHIVYQSTSNGTFSLYWIRSDGAGEPQRLQASPNNLYPTSFSPDGRRVAYHQVYARPGDDLWTLPLDMADPDHPKPGQPELFLRTPADNQWPVFSPDGRWIAYRSSESGTQQIYVRPFPGPGGKWLISEGPGTVPRWSPNGRELFYITRDYRIMVVDYAVNGNSFVAGRPRFWTGSEKRLRGADLAPDGKQLIGMPVLEEPRPLGSSVHVTFLLNVFDELRRRIPSSAPATP